MQATYNATYNAHALTLSFIVRLLPLTALIEAVRTVMLDGAGAGAAANQIGVMVAWGLISFVVAGWMCRWQWGELPAGTYFGSFA